VNDKTFNIIKKFVAEKVLYAGHNFCYHGHHLCEDSWAGNNVHDEEAARKIIHDFLNGSDLSFDKNMQFFLHEIKSNEVGRYGAHLMMSY